MDAVTPAHHAVDLHTVHGFVGGLTRGPGGQHVDFVTSLDEFTRERGRR